MNEAIWEHALKRISIEAFDALLSCGVRSLDGLLQLTSEAMTKVDVRKNIQSEILEMQHGLNICQKTTPTGEQSKEISKESIGDNRPVRAKCEDKGSGTPIPRNLLDRLSKRALSLLTHKNIHSIEQLMELNEKELLNISGIGRKTIHDILHLQVKIKMRLKKPRSSKLENKVKDREPKRKSPFRIRFRSLDGEHWPSDPAEWSLLSHNFLELVHKVSTPTDFPQNYSSLSISDLGISDDDLLRLRGVGLLPDDAAELLLSTSIGYLLNIGLSPESINNLINYIKQLIPSENDIVDLIVKYSLISDTLVFHNIDLTPVANLCVRSYLCDDIKCLSHNQSRFKWFELSVVSERHIINALDVN